MALTVQVTNGQVTVKAIPWGCWKELRQTFADTLKKEQLAQLVETVGQLLATADDDDDEPVVDDGETSVNMLVAEGPQDGPGEDPADVATPMDKLAAMNWAALMPQLVEAFAAGSGVLNTLLESVTDTLVLGCSSLDDLDGVPAIDVLAVRDAVLDENPLSVLLAAEGNLLAGLFSLGQGEPEATSEA